ncbi:MAG: DUF732 domain-containing protein [Mycobacterium sp.]
MRLLLAPLLWATAIVLAAPGSAEPGVVEAREVDTHEFITSLHQVGISFTDPEQAVAAGQAVCGLAANGESGLELLTDIHNANPALTINGAAQFAAIAAKSYCPEQLEKSGKSAK